ncbi:hypothetical protein MM236_06110 [Belliella sp. DSM 107340]|uniref:DUF6922 domain-containing protein n=1 Tax=Belliella calami TaxID=2923436 RepID=A0ABS9ULQ3_9BACT|nr:hypothetical protein [Belliella calami]
MKYFDLHDIDKKRHSSVRKHLLWEFDLKDFDFQKSKDIVIERVVQRGDKDDWLSVFNLYGVDVVKNSIRNIKYLNPKDLNFVVWVLEIPKEEMKCFKIRILINPNLESFSCPLLHIFQ